MVTAGQPTRERAAKFDGGSVDLIAELDAAGERARWERRKEPSDTV